DVPPAVNDAERLEGKLPSKRLSWRVHLLQIMGQDSLYKQFKLDEPWDSPHNIKLLPNMPMFYRCRRFEDPGPGMTYYRSFDGFGAVLACPGGVDLVAITNASGTANTIMVVEAGEPVPWTKPDDLDMDPRKPLPFFGGPKRLKFNALFADGHVEVIPQDIKPQKLRDMANWANTGPIQLPNGWDRPP